MREWEIGRRRENEGGGRRREYVGRRKGKRLYGKGESVSGGQEYLS